VRPKRAGCRSLLAAISAANERGLTVSAQVAARPVGILLGLEATINPLGASPTARPLGADVGAPRSRLGPAATITPLGAAPTARTLGADVEALRRDDVRATVLSEMRDHSPLFP